MVELEREAHVRILQPGDDRSGFHSGNIDLDRFFQRYAGQNRFRHHIGTTYVAIVARGIAGFVTVSSSELVAERLPRTVRRRLPSYPLPILRIARLAVDRRFQGHGIGRLLLRSMFELALELRERVGCVGVVVDAKADAVVFYGTLGFRTIEVLSGALGDRPEPVVLFLPIRQIEAAIQDVTQ